jgi:hypothetical protein
VGYIHLFLPLNVNCVLSSLCPDIKICYISPTFGFCGLFNNAISSSDYVASAISVQQSESVFLLKIQWYFGTATCFGNTEE